MAVLLAPSVAEAGSNDDYTATTATTGTISSNGSVKAEIEKPGDVDWFKTTLELDKEYRIDQRTRRETFADSAGPPDIKGIFDANGDKISGTKGHDTDPIDLRHGSRVYFQPSETATYYIAAGSHNKGKYLLELTEVPLDVPGSTATTATVADTLPATGEVHKAHERDWYKFDAVAGQTYEIDLVSQGAWLHHGTYDPYLVGVYNPSGSFIPGTFS